MPVAVRASLFVLAIAVVCAPYALAAQSSELENAIRAELLKDERAQLLSPEELNSLVQALSADAEGQNITASDISWRQAAPESGGAGTPAQTLPPIIVLVVLALVLG